MAKSMLAICLLLFLTCAATAQQLVVKPYPGNPFTYLKFDNSYKDTVTINATYLGEHGKTGRNDMVTLSQIDKLYGLNTSKFQNAIALSITGFTQKFYVPYREDNQSLLAAVEGNSMLKLKCTVYRFFTIDGICNFFYVDKVAK